MSTDVTAPVTSTTHGIDETTFGLGGATSHDADRLAAAADVVAPLPGFAWASADEVVEDSHAADIAAAYRHGRRPVKDGTGLHR